MIAQTSNKVQTYFRQICPKRSEDIQLLAVIKDCFALLLDGLVLSKSPFLKQSFISIKYGFHKVIYEMLPLLDKILCLLL